jgi:hypothetical protein
MKRILVGVVLVLLLADGAAAGPLEEGADAESYMILSSGAKPCGDFVAASPQRQQMDATWAIGFVSGQNSMDVGSMRLVGHGWTPDSVLVWLQNYCSQHPLEQFFTATERLRQELAAQEGLLPKEPEPSALGQQ